MATASVMYDGVMRTTIRIDDDVAAAAEQLRRERDIGFADAINELARAGLSRSSAGTRQRFRQRTAALGLKVDVSSVADALDLLDERDAGPSGPAS